MALDRAATLRQTEKHLSRGKLNAAIAACASGLIAEGFLATAGAVYKKVLKFEPRRTCRGAGGRTGGAGVAL